MNDLPIQPAVTAKELDNGVKQIQIENAEPAQLREFGAKVLGLDLRGNETKAIMQGKYAEVGYSLPFIRLQSAQTGVPTMQPRGTSEAFNTRENDRGETEVCIMIHTQEKLGGDEPVAVGVNGRLIYIPRGQRVFVQKEYVEALSHAEEFIYAQYDAEQNGGMGGLTAPRKVLSYPFSFA